MRACRTGDGSRRLQQKLMPVLLRELARLNLERIVGIAVYKIGDLVRHDDLGRVSLVALNTMLQFMPERPVRNRQRRAAVESDDVAVWAGGLFRDGDEARVMLFDVPLDDGDWPGEAERAGGALDLPVVDSPVHR